MIGIGLNDLQLLVFSKFIHQVGYLFRLELLSLLLNCVALYELLMIAFEPLAEWVWVVLLGPLECCSQDSHGHSWWRIRIFIRIFLCEADKQLLCFAAKA